MRFNLTEALQRRPRFFHFAMGAALFAVVAVLDLLTSREIAFAVFYLLPVSYFAWFFRPLMGVLAALVSAALWMLVDLFKEPPYSSSSASYLNGLISLGLFLAFVFLVAEVRDLYQREQSRSRSDFLTGLANARAFHEALSVERERALRYELPTTLAYIDADNFKYVNDVFGHEAGDRALVAIADGLRSNVRKSDLVARLGGDEFCILLPHTGQQSASGVLNKLPDVLGRAMERGQWQVTFSIGAVTFLHASLAAEEMIRRADAVMYAVKSTGKNQIAYAVEG